MKTKKIKIITYEEFVNLSRKPRENQEYVIVSQSYFQTIHKKLKKKRHIYQDQLGRIIFK